MATWGRPLGDFDVSENLGVSQSSAGDVVEKNRDSECAAKDVVRPISIDQSQSSNPHRKLFLEIPRFSSPFGRSDASRGPPAIFNCDPIVTVG